MVTIKFIMKGEQGEQEEEATGAMIEPTGLVLASNNAFGGLMARMGGSAPTPTDIKVLVGDDTQGVKAKIVARDTELGLAWVQIDDAPTTPYKAIDFGGGAESKVGDSIFMVSLMGKFFDRAPMVAEGHVSAVVSKPRHLIIPSIGLAGGEFGMPIFDSNGKAVGVSTLILPDQEEMEGNPGGMRAALRGITGGMILPAKDVVAATVRAKEMAKHPEAEPKKDGADAADKPAAAPAVPEPKTPVPPK
jgi:S1-C subfamily serine protease